MRRMGQVAAAILMVMVGLAGAAAADSSDYVVVRGHLSDPSGNPVAGASVTVDYTEGAGQDVLSDASGNYSMHGVLPGRSFVVEVRNRSGSFVAQRTSTYTGVAGEVVVRDVVLRRAGRVKVRLVGADGAARGTIDVTASGDYGPSATVATSTGEAEIGGLAQGRWNLDAIHPVIRSDEPDDWYLGAGKASVKVYAGQTTTVTVTMPEGGRVAGRVTAPGGASYGLTSVGLSRWVGGQYETVPEAQWTAANGEVVDGAYRLGPLPAGRYQLQVVSPHRNIVTTSVVLKAGRELTQDVRLGYTRVVTVHQPRLVGVARVGRLLRVGGGEWSPSGARATYKWYVGGRQVKPTTATTYRVPASARGRSIGVVAIASAPERARVVTRLNTPIVPR